MIRFNDYRFNENANQLIDFNEDIYTSFKETDNCINLILYNSDLEVALKTFEDILISMEKEDSVIFIKNLLKDYYSIRKKYANTKDKKIIS